MVSVTNFYQSGSIIALQLVRVTQTFKQKMAYSQFCKFDSVLKWHGEPYHSLKLDYCQFNIIYRQSMHISRKLFTILLRRNYSLSKMAQTAKKDDIMGTAIKNGEFVRAPSSFRNWITADGSSGFKAEAGRYHIYVSLACPWAHRTLITRKLKGLEDVISYTVVDFLMLDKGWKFNDKVPQCTKDPIFGAEYLREVYNMVSPDYQGRITVPVLFDKEKKTIVNNESSEIIRILSKEFNEFCSDDQKRAVDIYPEDLRQQIDAINEWVYPTINNGVYRSGFARTQEAYDKAVGDLFENLDKAEEVLSKSRYLVGDRLTEADIRLFTTLVRFDKVYHGHFKCNRRQIKDYPNLWGYLRDLYQTPGFGDTTDFDHIRKHYMMSHTSINPFSIVSVGPDLDFNSAHGRAEKFCK